MREASFTKEERLKKNTDIKRVFDKGVAFRTRRLNVYILDRQGPQKDLKRALCAVKRTITAGKPSVRNKYKRLLKEAYRSSKFLLPKGVDIVILLKLADRGLKSRHIKEEIKGVFKKYNNKNY